MPEEPINFSQLKGKIEKDDDWRDGVNAHRNWTTKEFEIIVQDIHDIKVFINRFQHICKYFEDWQKRQEREDTKIQGELL